MILSNYHQRDSAAGLSNSGHMLHPVIINGSNQGNNMSLELNKADYLDSKIGFFNKDMGITTIYVGNLSFDKTEVEIQDLFLNFGGVNYVKIIKDPQTTLSKGMAFVQMYNRKHAKVAIAQLNGAEVDGRTLKVSIAEENGGERKVKKRRKPYKPYVSKKDRGII